ncbi:MAG: divalent metal cation transporter [Chloroflexi bacterium]|nr:MAG: manganese transporter [Actinobacteria bacterium 13_1_40CM_66_12]TMF44011.1 MAG: divalent metal cation transporter [Chloroflexota bacterium]
MSEREPQKDAPRLVPTSAVIDEAHVGDIHGAFGTIRLSDVAPRRTWRRRILTLAAIIGPGLIVMVGDNDAGGVSTYAQAGQDYGYSLLWTLVLLVPVLIVNQEMVARLGAVTGVGYARLITERFGRSWGWYSVGNLFLLNFLTISTEFMGVTLGAEYFGFNRYIVVPLAAILLIAITLSGNFRSWERAMFLFLFASLLVIPLALLSHPSPGAVLTGFLVPGVYGGFTSNAALLIIAVVGTTVAPWQMFFQQSNVVDKRITPRWLEYEKADTVLGAVVVVIGAAAIMMATASAFTGNSDFGHFTDAYGVARGLHLHISPVVGAIFALLLIDASIVGASAVTLTTSYAFGDMFGRGFSLHRGFREAKLFYGMYAAMVVLAAAIVLIPHAPLGLITTAVQALAGILLPSTTVFAVLLCNDRAVLGPWINRPWLNVLAAIIVGTLLLLSLILVISTVVPSVDVTVLLKLLAPVILIVIAVGGVVMWWGSRRAQPIPPASRSEREGWRMPALALLERPRSSPLRRFAMLLLGSYVAFAVILLAVKAVQIALVHR